MAARGTCSPDCLAMMVVDGRLVKADLTGCKSAYAVQ